MNWRRASLMPLSLWVLIPTGLLAGPNEGGALVVHANPSITYTTGQEATADGAV